MGEWYMADVTGANDVEDEWAIRIANCDPVRVFMSQTSRPDVLFRLCPSLDWECPVQGEHLGDLVVHTLPVHACHS